MIQVNSKIGGGLHRFNSTANELRTVNAVVSCSLNTVKRIDGGDVDGSIVGYVYANSYGKSAVTKRLLQIVVSALLLLMLAACASSPPYQAEGQSSGKSPPQTLPSQTEAQTGQLQQKKTNYVVKKGDTLSAIARRFSVTALQIQYRNNIADPRRLKIGARLVIPDKSQQVPGSFASKARFIWPIKKLDVSSEFGSRNKRHKGIDLRAPPGTAIHASADGVVHFVGRKRGYGKVIILKHTGGIQTFYAHNDKNLVKKGQRVRQGDVIATVGRTGNATGNHVHFEIIRGRQPLNPRKYISG